MELALVCCVGPTAHTRGKGSIHANLEVRALSAFLYLVERLWCAVCLPRKEMVVDLYIAYSRMYCGVVWHQAFRRCNLKAVHPPRRADLPCGLFERPS